MPTTGVPWPQHRGAHWITGEQKEKDVIALFNRQRSVPPVQLKHIFGLHRSTIRVRMIASR